MRKLLSVSLVAVLTAVTAGCECWDCFTQFEACKNQALFGSTGGCAPYGAGYQYAAPAYDCAGVAADCAGVVVQSPVTGACGPAGCGPAGCGPTGYGMAPGMMVTPGQTVIGPGQVIAPGQVITPGATVVPGPETYAPTMQ